MEMITEGCRFVVNEKVECTDLSSLQEVGGFIDSSVLYGSSGDYVLENTLYGTYSFVHFSGVRLVVLSGEKTRLTQMFFRSAVSPAVLWFWDSDLGVWKIENPDFLSGSVRFWTISDFVRFYDLNVKGA